MVVQVIVFLVDNSSSMNQSTYLGTSLLDIAKNAVESFIKIRNRDNSGRHDRYILVNFDERPYCVKSGWKESHATFSAELKNLKGNAISTLGSSLRECFDFLNIPRLQSATDNYGMGRNPFYIEPACIILLSDGLSFTDLSGVENLLNLPNSGYEGAELTKQPFRWDQRLFSIILRIPGITPTHSVNPTQLPLLDAQQEINSMCEATGGKSYVVISQKSLTHSLESISTKIQMGVVVNFECLKEPIRGGSRSENRSSDSDPTYISNITCVRKLMYVKSNPKTGQSNGHWPIPEDFWPDANSNQLPPRNAHPTIFFDTKESHPLLIENFPFDKYELEPSPLTQHILNRKNIHTSSWQCYVMNSGLKEGAPRAFGYLRASSGGKHVNFFVMPYDYPIIIPLLDELSKQNFRPSSQWTLEFNKYLNSIPSYYIQPLKNSLRLFGSPTTLIPNSYDGNPSYNISTYLKKIKRQSESETKRVYTSLTQRELDVNVPVKPVSKRSNLHGLRYTCVDKLKKYRDILISPQPTRQLLQTCDYSIPISQMGNYQEYLSRVPPLREIDVCMSRTQLFANPYKIIDISAKNSPLDEPDEDIEDRYGFKAPADKRKSRHKIRPPSPNTPPRSMTPPPLSQLEKQLSWIEKRQTPGNEINYTHSSSKHYHTSYSFSMSPSPSPKRTETHRSVYTDSSSDSSYSHTHNSQLKSIELEETLVSREDSCILSDSKNLPVNHISAKRSIHASFSHSHSKRHKTESMVSESLIADVIKFKLIRSAKEAIRSEIRKPGKNYDNVFRILERLPGVEQKEVLVQEALEWATRFKKRSLIQLLETWKIRIYPN